MPLKIHIDRNLCESNFQCHEIDDTLFHIDEENDELIVPNETVSDTHESALKRAEQCCPKAAIRIESIAAD